MSKYKGNIVSPVQTVLSGTNYTGKANGRFSLAEQNQALQSSLWAKGLTISDAPSIGSALATAANTATVSFTAPNSNGGQTITGYIATSSPENITGTSTTSPVTVTGLTNGASYTFTVAAINPSGISAKSSPSNSVTIQDVMPPLPPSNITVTILGSSSASISFTPPTNLGSSTSITGYIVTCSVGATNGTSSPITVTGLTSQTSYSFTVQTVGNLSTSNASSPVSGKTTPTIGQALGGGYFAGQSKVNGVIYNLIVSPKATGNATGYAWGGSGTTQGTTSLIDGYSNTTTLASRGLPQASFCKNLTIGGYTDWYQPAQNELDILYYYLKPTTATNNTGAGANAYAVSPQPLNTNYTTTNPAQTNSSIFQSGGSESFATSDAYYSSSENAAGTSAVAVSFAQGYYTFYNKTYDGAFIRAIRKEIA